MAYHSLENVAFFLHVRKLPFFYHKEFCNEDKEDWVLQKFFGNTKDKSGNYIGTDKNFGQLHQVPKHIQSKFQKKNLDNALPHNKLDTKDLLPFYVFLGANLPTQTFFIGFQKKMFNFILFNTCTHFFGDVLSFND